MVVGLVIDLNGHIKHHNYTSLSDFNEVVDDLKKYKLVEIWETDEGEYNIYTRRTGFGFNSFDLQTINARSEIIVLKRGYNLLDFIDTDRDEFTKFYNKDEDLDQTLYNDELRIGDNSEDEYEFNDFVVEDFFDIEEQQDYQDYVEYLNSHRD